jgi:phage gp36-like protein
MTIALCTTAQLDRLLAAQGVVAFADHDENGVSDPLVVDDCIAFATAEICGRLLQRYEASVLSRAVVLTEYACVIAARALCTRRGNPVPDSIAVRYQEIIAPDGPLDQIAKGFLRMSDVNGNSVPQKRGFAPSHANLTVDRRFSEKSIRVVDGSSNMTSTALRRDVDLERVYE